MANESLLITKLPDGTFHVKETEAAGEDDPEPAIDQSVQSTDDVSQLVEQWLSDDSDDQDAAGGDDSGDASDTGDDSAGAAAPSGASGGGMKAAWDQEASSRNASGYRK